MLVELAINKLGIIFHGLVFLHYLCFARLCIVNSLPVTEYWCGRRNRSQLLLIRMPLFIKLLQTVASSCCLKNQINCPHNTVSYSSNSLTHSNICTYQALLLHVVCVTHRWFLCMLVAVYQLGKFLVFWVYQVLQKDASPQNLAFLLRLIFSSGHVIFLFLACCPLVTIPLS